MSDVLATSPLVRAIGTALIEFLWQGALIGLIAATAFRALRGSDPTTRYAVASLMLFAMASMPVATAVLAYRSGTSLAATATEAIVRMPSAAGSVTPAGALTSALDREQWMPAVVLVWGIGVALSGLHLTAGWLLVGALRKGARRLSREAQRQVTKLASGLGIGRHVQIAESTRVDVPTLVGWVRPLIVIPTSTLAGLSPSQFEAILVHELAHVRRHDYLVNVMQTVVEAALFYHPAVWWVSRRIRTERELCCDDLVVAYCGDRLTYARALAELEARRRHMPSLAVAANGGNLMHRITRLLGAAPADRSGTSIGGVLAVLIAVPFIVIAQTAASAHTPVPAGEMPMPTAQMLSLPHPAPPIAARDVARVQVATQASEIRSRYAELVSHYRGVLRTYSAENAQAGPPVPPPPPDDATRQAAEAIQRARRQAQVIDQINGLIRTAQQMIEAGRLTEASSVLTRVSELVAALPPPPPPPPPPPTGVPSATERAAANYAQGLAATGSPAAPNTPPLGVPVRVGGSVAAPTKIRHVDPIYPESAKAAGVQGIVILECVIDPGGNVVDIRLLRGNPPLNEAAIQAVSQWQYTAPSLGGSPVSVIMTVTVNFALN